MMVSYTYDTKQCSFGVHPTPNLQNMLETLGKELDFKQIKRISEKGVERTDYVLFLFNRCQPQDLQFEVCAPKSFVGCRVPFFCDVRKIGQNVKVLILWFMLEHSDGKRFVYRYLGRLFEKELYQQRSTFRYHARNTLFYGHQLPMDCVSLDGGCLTLAKEQQFDKKQQPALYVQALTEKQALYYCAENMRAFDSTTNGFLQNEDRRDVDHYLCFVAFTVASMADALKLLQKRLAPRQYQTFSQLHKEQIRECKDIAADANQLLRFHQILHDQSREYYRQLTLQSNVQKRRIAEEQTFQAHARVTAASSKNGNQFTIVPTHHIE